jgi:hypothetical protein
VDATARTNRYSVPKLVVTVDKIVSIIKNCLEEWKRRRDARQRSSSADTKKQPEFARSPTVESESECSETEISRPSASSEPPVQALLDTPSVSSISPLQPSLRSKKPPVLKDDALAAQFVQLQPSGSASPTFINPQFLPDLYLANSVSFNHGNAITITPTTPYEPLTALLNSDAAIHQTSTSQIKVTSSTRVENITQGSSHQEEEENVLGYTYSPSERIEKMFGISGFNAPTWK